MSFEIWTINESISQNFLNDSQIKHWSNEKSSISELSANEWLGLSDYENKANVFDKYSNREEPKAHNLWLFGY